jgi:heptosyltransferase I
LESSKLKILISRLSALGDAVCTLPVAVALKKQFPESEITWAIDPRFAGVVECCSSVDKIEKVKPGFNPKSWPRLGQFDLALDMQGLSKSSLIVALAKSPRKFGYHWQRELAPLFSSKVLPDPSSLHVVDQYLDVARYVGAEMEDAEFNLIPASEDRQQVTSMLESEGVSGAFVVMNAGAGWITKRWNPEHFAVLSDLLHEKGIQTVFIGGKAQGDIDAANSVFEQCSEKPISLLGKTNIRQLIALISLSNAHVGGDTGSTHIAAALGTPAIGLYSITKPVRSCPYGQIDRCHYAPSSLGDILPTDVFSTVMRSLG